jgi:hypothetical protein
MKTFGRFAMAIALLIPVGIAAAAPAGAAGGTTCKPPSGKITVTPGYGTTAKAQTIVFSIPFTGCKGGGVTSGNAKGTLKEPPGTCSSFGATLLAAKVATTITWNTKATSTLSLTSSTKGGAFTLSGTVTKGLFLKLKVTFAGTAALDTSHGPCSTKNPLKVIVLKGTKPFVIK